MCYMSPLYVSGTTGLQAQNKFLFNVKEQQGDNWDGIYRKYEVKFQTKSIHDPNIQHYTSHIFFRNVRYRNMVQ